VIKGEINSLYGLTYSVNGDNGQRTVMEYSYSYPVIFENAYLQATFISNDLVDNVNVLNLGERSYRGKMEVGRYGGSQLTAINIVPLNEYLYGVLPGEMPSTWPLEAQKAQAVAARNYGIYYALLHEKYPDKAYEICDTTSSQVYKGFLIEEALAKQAVDETAGMLIYYSDTVIPAYFFSSSGGHTESSENVWSGEVPYLTGVSDIYETDPEREPWLVSLTANEIGDKLAKYDVNIGSILDVEVSGYSEAGRALSLNITGTNGEYELVKETIRYWLGFDSRKFTLVKSDYVPDTTYDVLGSNGNTTTMDYSNIYVIDGNNTTSKLSPVNSQVIVTSDENIYNYPTLTGQNDTYIFVGEGWGHGVGMSQSGAKGMAIAGFTYDQILEHYYTGTEVRVYEPVE
jgi:stage II sporulation protein D